MSRPKDLSDGDYATPYDIKTLDVIDYKKFSPPPPCERGTLESKDSGVYSTTDKLNTNTQSQQQEIISVRPEEIRSIIRSELLPMLEKVDEIKRELQSVLEKGEEIRSKLQPVIEMVEQISTEMASQQDNAQLFDVLRNNNRESPHRELDEARANYPPYLIARDVNKQEFHTTPYTSNTVRRGVSRDNPDERECLAHALQKNVVEIVNDVIFNGSELPDCLLEDGCLTENESIRCRKQVDPKDQVRMVLSIIKGRDFSVLERFVKLIKSHNEHIGLIIEKQFNHNVKQGLKSTVCALCKLKQRVDLKYIADELYKNFLLEDGMYNMIFQTENPVGAQEDIWRQVLCWLNDQCKERKERKDYVKDILTEALVQKNHYCQLAKEIKCMISKEHMLVCQCRTRVIKQDSICVSPSVSSRSPYSSIADSTDSFNLETEPELSDAESIQKLHKPTSVNSNPELPEKAFHHDGKTNLEGQHKTTTNEHETILVAECQRKTSVSSTDAIKLTPEQSKFKPELSDKNESKTSDKEHKVVISHIRNKQKVLERIGIHNLVELKETTV